MGAAEFRSLTPSCDGTGVYCCEDSAPGGQKRALVGDYSGDENIRPLGDFSSEFLANGGTGGAGSVPLAALLDGQRSVTRFGFAGDDGGPIVFAPVEDSFGPPLPPPPPSCAVPGQPLPERASAAGGGRGSTAPPLAHLRSKGDRRGGTFSSPADPLPSRQVSEVSYFGAAQGLAAQRVASVPPPPKPRPVPAGSPRSTVAHGSDRPLGATAATSPPRSALSAPAPPLGPQSAPVTPLPPAASMGVISMVSTPPVPPRGTAIARPPPGVPVAIPEFDVLGGKQQSMAESLVCLDRELRELELDMQQTRPRRAG